MWLEQNMQFFFTFIHVLRAGFLKTAFDFICFAPIFLNFIKIGARCLTKMFRAGFADEQK